MRRAEMIFLFLEVAALAGLCLAGQSSKKGQESTNIDALDEINESGIRIKLMDGELVHDTLYVEWLDGKKGRTADATRERSLPRTAVTDSVVKNHEAAKQAYIDGLRYAEDLSDIPSAIAKWKLAQRLSPSPQDEVYIKAGGKIEFYGKTSGE